MPPGLVADDGEVVPVWAPTPEIDEWQLERGRAPVGDAGRSPGSASDPAPHLVGSPRHRHRAPPTPSAPTCSGRRSGRCARDVLRELADARAGRARPTDALAPRAPRAGADPTAPRRARRRPSRRVLREAEWLGVTGRGALSEAGRALRRLAATRSTTWRAAHGRAPALARRPRPRAGRPHRRRPRAARRAASARSCASPPTSSPAAAPPSTASRPSRCAGRSTPGGPPQTSPRRCAGRAAPRCPSRSSTSSSDVARRHGQTRIGGAAAYIRSDDEAVLDTMLASRDLAPPAAAAARPDGARVARADPRRARRPAARQRFRAGARGSGRHRRPRRDTAAGAPGHAVAAPARWSRRSTGPTPRRSSTGCARPRRRPTTPRRATRPDPARASRRSTPS